MPVFGHDAVCYFRESGYRFLAMEPEHAVAGEGVAAHHQVLFARGVLQRYHHQSLSWAGSLVSSSNVAVVRSTQ